ncbi:DUF4003 domain-containing protein [Clostridium sp. SHJSY1]|uniref:DUF4003 family protein n=1 Tax=Clostridium sp. SHJSY1 TaxID=2942483 RepID=UPI002876C2CA|nr:DUF4003 family protein [Clostridium sp. SHJSY1]MDS0524083.1 DUF4003 domain-containing protein [Clostridium sp. SHJSY1]
MKLKIRNICDLVIDNLRKAKEELRFDGDYINHFSSLIFSGQKKEVMAEKTKEVRILINKETSRMSSFRGDILYMVSQLIALENNASMFINEILSIYDKLMELGFKDSQNLVLASYALVKYTKEDERIEKILKMREIYEGIRAKYNNVTNHEDYLQCALLAINNVKKDYIIEYMDNIFDRYSKIEMLSNNSIQGLAMTLMINKNESAAERMEDLLVEFEKEDIKVSHQLLPLLGSVAGKEEPKKYINKINEVIKYLCDEEGQYEFYMDKGFRMFIAIAIIEYSRNYKHERYINELLSVGIYSMLVSKNQGILEDVLA